jgi:hypothetical protein
MKKELEVNEGRKGNKKARAQGGGREGMAGVLSVSSVLGAIGRN